MANITIGRYPVPDDTGDCGLQLAGTQFPSSVWECYIEPEDRSWILFVQRDGTPAFWPRREPSGAVIGEPTTR